MSLSLTIYLNNSQSDKAKPRQERHYLQFSFKRIQGVLEYHHAVSRLF